MDDIYGDLDNYEDVNSVQELRTENMELKVKLEEHATAMEKLQKDYDKLEMEFKRLQNNYSSLLKTARSEIERKTKRITQLNMDKDMMVLESLKNGKNIRRNFNKSVQSQGQANKKMEEANKLKNIDKRYRTTSVQTENYPNCGADNRISMVNKFDNVSAKPDSSYKNQSIVREKPTHKTEYNDTRKTRAGSIKDRRKSMPVVSMPDEKFSSDEENEHIYRVKETRTDSSIQDKFGKNINKCLVDRHSNKTSETSSIDDRASNYHESTSREIYRGRTGRHDNNSYRSRDKFKVSQKYRKGNSPERGQKRQHSRKEYQDDYYRQEQGRHRPRDNPPSDHDPYPRRNSDHRTNYDRHSYDHQKYRHHHDEKYGTKQKMPNDYDEPFTKRQKTENFCNPDVHNKVEKEDYGESMDIQSIPKSSPHQYDALRLSCQSPDYVYTDAALAYPIKEIMATATTPLEDPRMKSKRYTLIKDNDKETLSAVVGRNIDMRVVNKTLWNMAHVRIPDALMRRPSLTSYEIVKDIDINIDSPVANLSLESGEIHFESDREGNETRDQPKAISHVIQDSDIGRQVPEKFSKQVINLEEISKLNLAKYRIPKIAQSSRSAQNKKDVPIIDVNEIVSTENLDKKETAEDEICKTLLTRPQNDDHMNLLPSNKNGSKHVNKDNKNQVTLSKMAIVADDLELSDENSDNVDSHKQIITKYCKVQPNKQKEATSDLKNHSDMIVNTDKTKEPADTVETKVVKVDEETKTKEGSSDSSKKQKSKKKKAKCKEASKDSIESTNALPVIEKKKRPKKEKECKPKETNTKFSDLFGDSSSLMTPEDLGIPSYLPISEDAQDAVDLKINLIIDGSPIIDKVESSDGNKVQSSIERNKQEVKQHDNKAEIKSRKSKTDNKDVAIDNIKEKSIEEIDTNEISPCDIYENLNPGSDSNEPDIFKTVIISTGVQPQITFENNSEPVLVKPNADVEVHTKPSGSNCYSIPATMDFKRQDILKALATSTPHKETALNSLPDNRTNNITISDARSSKTIESGAVQAVDETNINMPDSQDTPDVRIFVKRRRKVMKRPPMT